jgi:hypothetical protein
MPKLEDLKLSEIKTYNAFGLVTVTKRDIATHITLVNGENTISNSILPEETYWLDEIEEGETAYCAFAVLLVPNTVNIPVVTQNKTKSGVKIIEIPNVEDDLQSAIRQFSELIFRS